MIGQLSSYAILIGLGVGAGVIAYFVAKPNEKWIVPIIASVAVASGVVGVVFISRNDSKSVELDGDLLTAHHLLTGRAARNTISDIQEIVTMLQPIHGLGGDVVWMILGRVRGVEVRMRYGGIIKIWRSNPAMRHAAELVQAIIGRMQAIAPIEAELLALEGQPLVHRVYWRADQSKSPTQYPSGSSRLNRA
jgi:hypothetical protein